jgi:hypothetical protein
MSDGFYVFFLNFDSTYYISYITNLKCIQGGSKFAEQLNEAMSSHVGKL